MNGLSATMLRALRLADRPGGVGTEWARIRRNTVAAVVRRGLARTWIANHGALPEQAVNDVRYLVTTDAGKPLAAASRAARAAKR